MRPAPALVALALLAPGASAEPTRVWAFSGDAVLWSDSPVGALCPLQGLFGQPGKVALTLVDSPGGSFDVLGFAFEGLAPQQPAPCAFTRAGCFGEGDAERGWRGVCAEGLPYVTWWLRPRAGGGYEFSTVTPLLVGVWVLQGPVGAVARVPAPA